jgi:hypothetical protein
VVQQAGEVRPDVGVEEEGQRRYRHGPSDASARGLQEGDDQKNPQDQVGVTQRVNVRVAGDEVIIVDEQIEKGGHPRAHEGEVRPAGSPLPLGEGIDQKNEGEGEGQMDGPMEQSLRSAEKGGLQMVQGHGHGDEEDASPDDSRGFIVHIGSLPLSLTAFLSCFFADRAPAF